MLELFGPLLDFELPWLLLSEEPELLLLFWAIIPRGISKFDGRLEFDTSDPFGRWGKVTTFSKVAPVSSRSFRHWDASPNMLYLTHVFS